MSDKEPIKELTKEEKLFRRLARARKFHKMAVRWLFDVSRLAGMYKAESWKDSYHDEMAGVAEQDYEDAMRDVIRTRELINKIVKELKEHSGNE